ncbi:MAG: ABC transporter permease [Rhodoglobus sp.]
MNDFHIPLGDVVEEFTSFLLTNVAWLFDALSGFFKALYELVEAVLIGPPFWAVGLVIAAIAFATKGWKLALGTALGIGLVVGLSQWEASMETLALVIVAASIAIAASVPLGIWAASSSRVSATLRPILDFMQTMPAFVYLIPAILLFRAGVVPAIVATIVFAMAPGARLTELGIRGVDKEVVEAGFAFGASPARVLRQIQLPLAMPTILAGINQIIMLSLSMVVIAGMVGAGGLGNAVVSALQRVEVGPGFEAGIAVVLLAIYLDRVTGSLGNRNGGVISRTVARLRKPRTQAAA